MGRKVTTGVSKRQDLYRAAAEYLIAMEWLRHNRSRTEEYTYWTHPNPKFADRKFSTAEAIEIQLQADDEAEYNKRWRPARISGEVKLASE